ncbi:hypothetical protein SAMN05518865_12916 [Duganella sp. CF458]|uniref:hypothetical protein n=1 Tax=Duganella sp. CF458 TaxID=1884368 RepID=UPI0008E51329|nr:hypothetical protein [Duganella sp. CF458]SFH00697.1 hypothetical protein SAMN05518865_12916 [Duganella sp. CF458]
MKTIVCVLACWLAMNSVHGAESAAADACAARLAGTVPPAMQVTRLREPVEQAIATLDNAQLALPSPLLASGTISYLDISPALSEQTSQICVLGYFELHLARGGVRSLPLVVESVRTLNSTPHATRVYFRVPHVNDFSDPAKRENLDNWWEREHGLQLKIAAFDHSAAGQDRPYFGRDLAIAVSCREASIIGACIFAILFYVVAGLAIMRPASGQKRAWSGVGHLLPWNIAGANGHASLSQLQMLVFTLIVATLLFYQWMRTGLLQEISTDLLYLIGISTAGTAATQVATSIRKDLDPAVYQYVQELGWFTAPLANAGSKASARGLLMTNGRFDIYKFQMLVFSCVIAAYVIASGAKELGNIQISATLLTLMGMSQGAYVGGRAAADALTPLQDQLRGMQSLQLRYKACRDTEVGAELSRRFRLAAGQAASLFSNMFGRVLPDYMLEMPLDAALDAPQEQ